MRVAHRVRDCVCVMLFVLVVNCVVGRGEGERVTLMVRETLKVRETLLVCETLLIAVVEFWVSHPITRERRTRARKGKEAICRMSWSWRVAFLLCG